MNITHTLLVALLLTTVAQAKTLVVNPALHSACDANPGSGKEPLRTISRAAALVQPGDVVLIHAGVYSEKVIIAQSGTKDQPIRFEAAPGATVIITGADLLTGWSKDAEGTYFDDCTVEHNNVKNFPRGWEAGGEKLVFTRGAVLENSRFLKNHGCGVWFDISNADCTVRNCLIADNEDAGIFYEISYNLHAHDNVVVGNGLAKTNGAWAANGGICLSSSPGCVIERNLILGNEQGFCFREQNRTTARVDGTRGPGVPIWIHDEIIRDNRIVNNRTSQVQGWFDIATERHWPKEMQTGQVEGGKAKEDWAAGYRARKDGVSTGLSLENLKITFQGNIYARDQNQPFFIWGANWKRKRLVTVGTGFRMRINALEVVVSLPPAGQLWS